MIVTSYNHIKSVSAYVIVTVEEIVDSAYWHIAVFSMELVFEREIVVESFNGG